MVQSKLLAVFGLRHRRTVYEQGSGGTTRVLVMNDPEGSMNQHAKYATNYITTAKYTLLTFLPVSLFEQYRRPANAYFTLMAALSLTALSPFSPVTTFLPLGWVLGLSILKEGYEDFRRHKSDAEENGRHVDVFSQAEGRFQRRRWDEVQVGDVVRVRKDEMLPADLLLLNSSTDEGVCYVETANLDGETNLKIKKGPDETRWVTESEVANFHGELECELPNPHLYTFVGNMHIPQRGSDAPVKLPLHPSQILLRGSALRKTAWAIGAVIYTGAETKVFMNSSSAKSKRSTIERSIDQVVVFMFILLFTLCVISASLATAWVDGFRVHWYLQPVAIGQENAQYNADRKGLVFIFTFLNTLVLYGYLVPISLYVSVEIVRIIVSMLLINTDISMYDPISNQPCQARTSNLNDELGMIEIVLSDKTGTLTQNQMEFFKCSIAGVDYGIGKTEVERALESKLPNGADGHVGASQVEEDDPAQLAKVEEAREKGFNFWDDRLMEGAWEAQPSRQSIELFLRCLAVCHTVIPDGPADPDAITYEAESPDEEALLVAAKKMGFFFHKRSTTTVTVRETARGRTQDVTYELLNVLDFNSTRKRMSVVCRRDDGRIILFCKGADSVIYERLGDDTPRDVRDNTRLHLQRFADAGPRTLCLAFTEVRGKDYDRWAQVYNAARTSIEGREEKLMAAYELIEKNLVLLGATAIEDKLQVGVPKTIEQLLDAGIKVWVLTGDKLETAVNIGHACNLLRHDMDITVLNADTRDVIALEEQRQRDKAVEKAREETRRQLDEAYARVVERRHSSIEGASPHAEEPDFGLVVAGRALGHCLEDDAVRGRFWQLASRCSSVVCCRVSPKEKGMVTKLCGDMGLRTLAIGDGANDVQMIRQAQVGVGISGFEGRQAVMASDFAIAQFRFLETLLLVHGRWCYKRVSRMVNYFFHKNIVFGLSIFYSNATSRFTGGMTYDEFYISIYNVIFTALPPVIVGIFDQDVPREACYRYPGLYRQGIDNHYFSIRARVGWTLSALAQSALVYYPAMACLNLVSAGSDGHAYSLWMTGITLFTCVIVTVHLQLIIVLDFWNWLHHFSIWGSIIVWFIFLLIYGALPPGFTVTEHVWLMFREMVGPLPKNWFVVLCIPALAVFPEFFFRAVKRQMYPDDHHIVQEYLKYKERSYFSQRSNEHLARAIAAALRERELESSHHRARSTANGASMPGEDLEEGPAQSDAGADARSAVSARSAKSGKSRGKPPVAPFSARASRQSRPSRASKPGEPPDVEEGASGAAMRSPLARASSNAQIMRALSQRASGQLSNPPGSPFTPKSPFDTPGAYTTQMVRRQSLPPAPGTGGPQLDWSSGVMGSMDLDVHHYVTSQMNRAADVDPQRHKRGYSGEAVVLDTMLQAPVDDILEMEKSEDRVPHHRRGARGAQ